MRIGIDISQIVYEGTGVSRFTKGIIESVLTHETTHEWVFFLSSLRKKPDEEIMMAIKKKGFKLIRYYFPPLILSILWNEFHTLPIEKIIGKVDWFITSDWTEPPTRVKKATIVHDLTFKRYPETVDSTIQFVQEKRFSWIEDESTLIFADSLATQEDLITTMGYDKNRIIVNYPGVTTNKQTDDQINTTLNKYNLNRPFILSVGKLEPRKNIQRLIEAFNGMKSDCDLAIVGPKGWDTTTKDQQKPNDKIKWLGYVSDDELYALYQSALFFIFPSIWEGFGYPAVEAMQLGCPCALADTSSLSEIGKEAAFHFDPWKIDSIKDALEKMTSDEGLRNNLIKKGIEKSATFTWKRYFDTMIESLVKNK